MFCFPVRIGPCIVYTRPNPLRSHIRSDGDIRGSPGGRIIRSSRDTRGVGTSDRAQNHTHRQVSAAQPTSTTHAHPGVLLLAKSASQAEVAERSSAAALGVRDMLQRRSQTDAPVHFDRSKCAFQRQSIHEFIRLSTQVSLTCSATMVVLTAHARLSKATLASGLVQCQYIILFLHLLEFRRHADEVRLLSLENGQEYFFDFSDSDLDGARDLLIRTAHNIAANRFDPSPGKHCRACHFRFCCPAW